MATAKPSPFPPTHHRQLLKKVTLYKISSELVQDQRQGLQRGLRQQQKLQYVDGKEPGCSESVVARVRSISGERQGETDSTGGYVDGLTTQLRLLRSV